MSKRVISAILTLKDRDFSSNLKRASERTDDLGRGVTMIGNKIQAFRDRSSEAFRGVMTTATAAAGAIMATGLTTFFTTMTHSMLETESAFKKLETMTGATGAKLAGLETIAKTVFKAGFGENIADVSRDIATLSSMFSNLNETQLTEVAKGAATIGETWGFETKEVARSVQALTNNFKGLSNSKAMDLMTYAFQKTGNYSDDLLDTFNEYSMHFAKLGLSAEQFTGILIKGAQNGAWNMDKVADSVKEFGIRAIDGSKTTAAGFKMIGFKADDMAKKIGMGGKSAQNAFMATVAGLAAIKDPIKRNTAGVSLFGTQWEDVRDKVILSMTGASDAVKGFEGATKRATETAHSGFGSRVKGAWRDLQLSIADAANGAGAQKLFDAIATGAEKSVPLITDLVNRAIDFGNTIKNNWGPIKETIVGIGTAVVAFKVGMIGLSIINGITTLIQGYRTAMATATVAQWAMNTAMLANPATWVVAGIAALIAIGVALYRNWDTVKAKAMELWDKIYNLKPGVLSLLGPFGMIVDAGIQIYKNWDTIKATATNAFGVVKGWIDDVKSSWNAFKNSIMNFKMPEFITDIGNTIGSATKKVKGFINGSHATGLNYVPFDGYVAELHKGEMVVPAREAEQLRQNGILESRKSVANVPSVTNTTQNVAPTQTNTFHIAIQAAGKTTGEIVNELVPQLKLALANM